MRPVTIVLGGLVVLLSLVVSVVLFRAFGDSPDIGFGPRGYTVHSDRSVSVVFEVHKPASRTAVCTVRARDRTGAEVGNSLVRVGPAPKRSVIVTYELPTSGRAADGEITACTLSGSAPSG